MLSKYENQFRQTVVEIQTDFTRLNVRAAFNSKEYQQTPRGEGWESRSSSVGARYFLRDLVC